MKNTLFLFIAVLTACKSAEGAGEVVPCERGATELAKRLEIANGRGLDRTDPKTQSAIDAAKSGLEGKRFAFKDCHFDGQGNDTVSFAPTGSSSESVDCVMAGGEAGNKEFRRAAMALDDQEKMKLDVTGVVKPHEDRLALTDCKITPHE
jgi:hypothetical protein